MIIAKTFAVSLAAIFATLLFFDLRARREQPVSAALPAGWLPPVPPAPTNPGPE